jgi:pyrophosphatase PpaX
MTTAPGAMEPSRHYVSAMIKPRIILFDLDGTLIDSVRLILDSYHHTLRTHELPERTDEQWLRGIGTPLSVQFADCSSDPEELARLIATYREYNLAHHDSLVSVYPGIMDAIRSIRDAGARTGLVTSKNRGGALRGLAIAGLTEMMDVLVCADEVKNPKPHPEPVEKAVRLLEGNEEETIYVGDSIHDMQSGRAAGVRTAAALWGPFSREHLIAASPDYWLETPSDIVRLLD